MIRKLPIVCAVLLTPIAASAAPENWSFLGVERGASATETVVALRRAIGAEGSIKEYDISPRHRQINAWRDNALISVQICDGQVAALTASETLSRSELNQEIGEQSRRWGNPIIAIDEQGLLRLTWPGSPLTIRIVEIRIGKAPFASVERSYKPNECLNEVFDALK